MSGFVNSSGTFISGFFNAGTFTPGLLETFNSGFGNLGNQVNSGFGNLGNQVSGLFNAQNVKSGPIH
ncbi:hypothetical protein CKW46_09465 [Mycobacterium liflandii]|nr:hypothetical protein BB170200_00613 [Mycobacterium marinum]ULL09855.1 hypothetical protein CKW46_09465 [Mycobacterium liflandii]